MSMNNSIALLASAGGDYQISRSVRLRSNASAYLGRATGIASSVQGKATLSLWCKRGALGAKVLFHTNGGSATDEISIGFNAQDQLEFYCRYASTVKLNKTSTAVFRDTSAWYHIVVMGDVTSSVAADRARIYVNGLEITSFSTDIVWAQNTTNYWNSGGATGYEIGGIGGTSRVRFDGLLAEINHIDGQALTASSFGFFDPVTGVWAPKKYSGTYGSNGFYLNFSDNSAATAAAIGKDYSINALNWTPFNISVTAGTTWDSMLDVPTMWDDGGKGRGNYCVLNPLSKVTTASLVEGNLATSSASSQVALGSIGMDSGKWYWECQMTGSSAVKIVGVYGTTNSSVATGAAVSAVIGVRFDRDAGTLDYTLNGTSWTSIATGLTSTTYFPYFQNTTAGAVITANFGQRAFIYAPPTGFKALNTQNLPDPTIIKGNKHFDAKTYTGNGSDLKITTEFLVDLSWQKGRSNAQAHFLQDSVRGILAGALRSSDDAAEGGVLVSSFDSDGVTFNANANTNTLNYTYVSWLWKAGGVAISNTAGSIASQVSSNLVAGFSIVTYTGTGANATVGHGLGVAPKMIIIKQRDGVDAWQVYRAELGATKKLSLNATDASTATTLFNSTEPTSSVFSLGSGTSVNQSGGAFVAYCFSEVAGFSKFGSYSGNGSADGSFVYCGFKPSFILVKRTDTTSEWRIHDTSRGLYNVDQKTLSTNLTDVENASSDALDILSNGFKRRANDSFNTSAGTYIYMAFAENPFKYSLAR